LKVIRLAEFNPRGTDVACGLDLDDSCISIAILSVVNLKLKQINASGGSA